MSISGGIKIHVLHCGCVSLPRRAAFGGPALPARRVDLPVSAYLIEHPQGLILVDTGWSREISPRGVYEPEAVRRVLPRRLADFYRPRVAPGQTACEQLEAMDISPTDLDLILLTHLDPDHVSGLKELSGAKRLLMAEEERWWTARTVYSLRQPRAMWEPYPIDTFWYKGSPIGPNRWAHDLFGDESVILVNVPGHTEGMFALIIKNRGRFVLLASDAAFSSRSWREMLVPGFGFNPKAQEKSLLWLREQSRLPDCAACIANHDPAEKPRVITL